MGRRLIQRHGPPGLVMDGRESRSHRRNKIVADYLAFAHSGRAWYLTDEGSSYERRWHAKCRTHSDCAVTRHKTQKPSGRLAVPLLWGPERGCDARVPRVPGAQRAEGRPAAPCPPIVRGGSRRGGSPGASTGHGVGPHGQPSPHQPGGGGGRVCPAPRSYGLLRGRTAGQILRPPRSGRIGSAPTASPACGKWP